jgi:phosphoribosylanthranilate isomerase
MMVKICGITNRDDALAAVEAGASAIGFNFYRDSPRYISPTGAALIAEKLPASVWKVGVFVNDTTETVAKVALDAGLDVAQLHGTAEARGIRIWRARAARDTPLEGIADDDAEAILLDNPSAEHYGGTGITFDWWRARGLPKNIVIAGGLDASNVRLAIEAAQPWGVDACSRIEKSPGLKDHEKMNKFVKAALGL